MAEQRSAMWEQIYSLPEMVAECLPSFLDSARAVLTPDVCGSIAQIHVVGCGDSHMAAVGAELAFYTLAGLPTCSATALHFARYVAPSLAECGREGSTLLIGVSVSGEVARTVEAIRLARKAGAVTAAVTGALHSRLALSADHVLQTAVPPQASPVRSPGVRSYMASLLMLYSAAVRVGEVRGFLSAADAAAVRDELRQMPEAIAATLRANDEAIDRLVMAWQDAQQFVFLGGGPNYGTALFSAAKLLEASGDAALGQDTEEWAHLQYFAREVATPTFVIDAQGRSYSRACEVTAAARAIGRRVAAVVPQGETVISSRADAVLPVLGGVGTPSRVLGGVGTPSRASATAPRVLGGVGGTREAFSPLLYSLPGMLIASYRAQVLQESYYRAFGGGRSACEGGGASRVQSSALQEECVPPRGGRTECR
jgi:glucosamine--fructose-6-phosphate aminotransferase (isomerizing)